MRDEYQAAYRAAHREERRAHNTAYYAANRERILAARKAAARARDIARLHRCPRCMICSTPLTASQVRRGVTCSVKCKRLRYNWFVRKVA